MYRVSIVSGKPPFKSDHILEAKHTGCQLEGRGLSIPKLKFPPVTRSKTILANLLYHGDLDQSNVVVTDCQQRRNCRPEAVI